MYVRLSDSPAMVCDEPRYIYIPPMIAAEYGLPGGVRIREDYLDYLTPQEHRILLAQIGGEQPEVYSGQMSLNSYMADGATRRKRREEKKAAKQKKREDKNERKNKKNAAKADLIAARAQAKREGKGGDVLGSVMSGLGSVLGIAAPGSQAPDTTVYDDEPPSTPAQSQPWYTTPLGIGGIVLGTAALGYGAYKLSTRNN